MCFVVKNEFSIFSRPY